MLPYIGFINFIVSLAYPTFKSYNAISEPLEIAAGKTPLQYMQWSVYWSIYTCMHVLEKFVFFFLVPYIPLYYEIRALFFLWLCHPNYMVQGV
eukprot:GHVO01063110.1.p1 GENE.GHVO01063110.1~~GHVO01063110.1.p1  ORF type:complete len:101 (-),score=7.49 GHVO01063110.1:305-583(-)